MKLKVGDRVKLKGSFLFDGYILFDGYTIGVNRITTPYYDVMYKYQWDATWRVGNFRKEDVTAFEAYISNLEDLL